MLTPLPLEVVREWAGDIPDDDIAAQHGKIAALVMTRLKVLDPQGYGSLVAKHNGDYGAAFLEYTEITRLVNFKDALEVDVMQREFLFDEVFQNYALAEAIARSTTHLVVSAGVDAGLEVLTKSRLHYEEGQVKSALSAGGEQEAISTLTELLNDAIKEDVIETLDLLRRSSSGSYDKIRQLGHEQAGQSELLGNLVSDASIDTEVEQAINRAPSEEQKVALIKEREALGRSRDVFGEYDPTDGIVLLSQTETAMSFIQYLKKTKERVPKLEASLYDRAEAAASLGEYLVLTAQLICDLEEGVTKAFVAMSGGNEDDPRAVKYKEHAETIRKQLARHKTNRNPNTIATACEEALKMLRQVPELAYKAAEKAEQLEEENAQLKGDALASAFGQAAQRKIDRYDEMVTAMGTGTLGTLPGVGTKIASGDLGGALKDISDASPVLTRLLTKYGDEDV
jgi:DNA-binding protein H-NS